MAKFTVVKQAPETVGKGEIVLTQANFLEQIEQNARKAPKHGQTAVHHLREILNSIAEKYDHDMNPMGIKVFNYVGLAFNTNEDLSSIIVRLLKNEYPVIFDKVLAHQLKGRPINTKLVYYVGDFSSTKPFYEAGLDLLDEKDVEGYLTGKPKKTVGKPAVTNEEANKTNE
jgi:hypothetical protein